MQRAGFPPLCRPERAQSRDFRNLSASAAWHAMLPLLLFFVFQVPTFPVGVTASFEVLASTPVPQLIFLAKGTNCCSCREGGAGGDAFRAARRGWGWHAWVPWAGGCWGHVPPEWQELWCSLCVLSHVRFSLCPPAPPRDTSIQIFWQHSAVGSPSAISCTAHWGKFPTPVCAVGFQNWSCPGRNPPIGTCTPQAHNSGCQKMTIGSFMFVHLHEAAETCWQVYHPLLLYLVHISHSSYFTEMRNLLQRHRGQFLMRRRAFCWTFSNWFHRATLSLAELHPVYIGNKPLLPFSSFASVTSCSEIPSLMHRPNFSSALN